MKNARQSASTHALPTLERLFAQGFALHQKGQFAQARQVYEQVLSRDARHFDSLHLLGVIALHEGRLDTSVAQIRLALVVNPDSAAAHYNLGLAYAKQERLHDAMDSFNQALVLQPGYPQALNQRGIALARLSRTQEALEDFRRAIEMAPTYATAYHSLGVLLMRLKLDEQALAVLDKALALQPRSVRFLACKGSVLFSLHRLAEAVECFQTVLEWDPDHEFVDGFLLHLRMKMCDWAGFDAHLARIQAGVAQGRRVIYPFHALGLLDALPLQRKVAEIYVQAKHPVRPFTPLAPLAPLARIPGKITIAYFSADFHNHATTHLMAEMLESHDKARFCILAFSFGPDSQDAMRQRVMAAVDRFMDVRHLSDEAVVQQARQLGVDIAVDLKGYTTDARPGIFARRCAPVQVNYMGYAGTLGSSVHDYIVVDKTVVPPEHAPYFSEKLVHLSASYMCNDSRRPLLDTPVDRGALGLPVTGFVFCCFNNNHKILPAIFDAWMRILQAVPGSVLWLLKDNEWVEPRLQACAQGRGISPDRLVFAPRVSVQAHLARHRAADLFLDTWPFNAHTTASDALWLGLPVLTLAGQSFASRVASSLLNVLDLPELVTRSPAAYEHMAIELATRPALLASLQSRLVQQRHLCGLFDGRSFARRLENAYAAMWHRAEQQLPPAPMDLSPDT